MNLGYNRVLLRKLKATLDEWMLEIEGRLETGAFGTSAKSLGGSQNHGPGSNQAPTGESRGSVGSAGPGSADIERIRHNGPGEGQPGAPGGDFPDDPTTSGPPNTVTNTANPTEQVNGSPGHVPHPPSSLDTGIVPPAPVTAVPKMVPPGEQSLSELVHALSGSLRMLQSDEIDIILGPLTEAISGLDQAHRRGWTGVRGRQIALQAMQTVRRLREHLGAMAAGEPLPPVRLWPSWSAMCERMGQPVPEPELLFGVYPVLDPARFQLVDAQFLKEVVDGAANRLARAMAQWQAAEEAVDAELSARQALEVFDSLYALHHRANFQAYWLVWRARLSIGLLNGAEELLKRRSRWLDELALAEVEIRKFGDNYRFIKPARIRDALLPMLRERWPEAWGLGHPALVELDACLRLTEFWREVDLARDMDAQNALRAFDSHRGEIIDAIEQVIRTCEALHEDPSQRAKRDAAQALLVLHSREEWIPGTNLAGLFHILKHLADRLNQWPEASQNGEPWVYEAASAILLLQELIQRPFPLPEVATARVDLQSRRWQAAVSQRLSDLKALPAQRWDDEYVRHRQTELLYRTMNLVRQELESIESAWSSVASGMASITDKSYQQAHRKLGIVSTVLSTLGYAAASAIAFETFSVWPSPAPANTSQSLGDANSPTPQNLVSQSQKNGSIDGLACLQAYVLAVPMVPGEALDRLLPAARRFWGDQGPDKLMALDRAEEVVWHPFSRSAATKGPQPLPVQSQAADSALGDNAPAGETDALGNRLFHATPEQDEAAGHFEVSHNQHRETTSAGEQNVIDKTAPEKTRTGDAAPVKLDDVAAANSGALSDRSVDPEHSQHSQGEGADDGVTSPEQAGIVLDDQSEQRVFQNDGQSGGQSGALPPQEEIDMNTDPMPSQAPEGFPDAAESLDDNEVVANDGAAWHGKSAHPDSHPDSHLDSPDVGLIDSVSFAAPEHPTIEGDHIDSEVAEGITPANQGDYRGDMNEQTKPAPNIQGATASSHLPPDFEQALVTEDELLDDAQDERAATAATDVLAERAAFRHRLTSSGVVDPSAEAGDPEVIQAFWDESETLLANVPSLVSTIVDSHDPEIHEDIRRVFHTIKGSGRLAGYRAVGEVASWVEQALRSRGAQHYDDDTRIGLQTVCNAFISWIEQSRAAGQVHVHVSVDLWAAIHAVRGEWMAMPAPPAAQTAPLSGLPEQVSQDERAVETVSTISMDEQKSSVTGQPHRQPATAETEREWDTVFNALEHFLSAGKHLGDALLHLRSKQK